MPNAVCVYIMMSTHTKASMSCSFLVFPVYLMTPRVVYLTVFLRDSLTRSCLPFLCYISGPTRVSTLTAGRAAVSSRLTNNTPRGLRSLQHLPVSPTHGDGTVSYQLHQSARPRAWSTPNPVGKSDPSALAGQLNICARQSLCVSCPLC